MNSGIDIIFQDLVTRYLSQGNEFHCTDREMAFWDEFPKQGLLYRHEGRNLIVCKAVRHNKYVVLEHESLNDKEDPIQFVQEVVAHIVANGFGSVKSRFGVGPVHAGVWFVALEEKQDWEI